MDTSEFVVSSPGIRVDPSKILDLSDAEAWRCLESSSFHQLPLAVQDTTYLRRLERMHSQCGGARLGQGV